MNKKSDPYPDEIKNKVLAALENPKYRYRTVSGIAKEVNTDRGRVESVLKNSANLVRESIAKASDGSTLFASKKNVSMVGDVWTAFKAVNRAKYGR